MKFIFSITNNDKDWDVLVNTSAQGNIFSSSLYLNSTGSSFTRYIISKPHGEVLAGVAVMNEADGHRMCASPFPFTPYQGILFSKMVAIQPNHKRIKTEYDLTDFFIQELIVIYGNFNMSLSPSFSDIRPFLWYNYDKPTLAQFSIQNRYTSSLDIHGFEMSQYLSSIRSVRRQERKKFSGDIVDCDDVDVFLNLYLKTFERQGIIVAPERQMLVRNIIKSSLRNGYGQMKKAVTASGIASMTLFVFDHNRAYYLFGANDPGLRNSGASTALMINNIFSMSEKGLSQIDFVGVNSPNRGDFKLSFNSALVPYHEVSLAPPKVEIDRV